MNIEGTYTFQSRLTEIRQSLTKQEVLQQAIPGLERLEVVGKDHYTVAIHIKYPPLAGTYSGHVSIVEGQQPTSYRLFIENNGGPNTITGVGSIQLHEQGDNTTIIYKGTLTLNKRGARLAPAVTKGAVKLLLQQFLTTLSDQLRAEQVTSTESDPDTASDIVIAHSLPEVQKNSSSMAYKIMHFLHLGQDDLVQEAVWTERIRRIGLVGGFLLLVWVGTRIPRKRD